MEPNTLGSGKMASSMDKALTLLLMAPNTLGSSKIASGTDKALSLMPVEEQRRVSGRTATISELKPNWMQKGKQGKKPDRNMKEFTTLVC